MSNIYDNEKFFTEYAKMPRSKNGLEAAGEWHQLQLLFPNLENKKVLDLGCGYGWHTKYAISLGASFVLGIDGSKKMIEVAKKKNYHPNIQYEVCNLNDYDYPQNTYDFVVSNLVLHYLENLDLIYQKVFKTLKKGGCFLFNIEHPIFTASPTEEWVKDEKGNTLYWPIDNYFYTGPKETVFLNQKVIKQHHTLTQILNSLLQSGFKIETIEEAMPSREMLTLPDMRDEMRRPMMLLVKAIKE